VDFPLLSSCSLVVTFPPEIKIGIDETFQNDVLAADGFLELAKLDIHTPFSTTAAAGAHNIVKVKDACANGNQEYPSIGSITFGNIVSPA
jgi:hypothetical protein